MMQQKDTNPAVAFADVLSRGKHGLSISQLIYLQRWERHCDKYVPKEIGEYLCSEILEKSTAVFDTFTGISTISLIPELRAILDKFIITPSSDRP